MINPLILRKISKHIRLELVSCPQYIEIGCVMSHLDQSVSVENFPQKSRLGVEKLVSDIEDCSGHFFLVKRDNYEILFVLTVRFFRTA